MKNRATAKELKELLKNVSSISDPLIQDCLKDERKAVQQLAKGWIRLHKQEQKWKQQFEQMSVFEKEAREKGFLHIAGIDEAGRGPIAGPVVAAAVILPKDFVLFGLTDSKQLAKAKREQFYDIIVREAEAYGIGVVSEREIDEINIYQAAKSAMMQAVRHLNKEPDMLLIDAMELPAEMKQESLIKGDARSISIAAASVLAKVTRDRLMEEIAMKYPEYGFQNHMGYGTKEHLSAIAQYGITVHHRRSFAPVRLYAEEKEA
ncbi:ribonuclease HII [Metabacillus sp. GX 13764]|uniref:ribonuclease HII n=1 Tax=Metabacillus kandeliae TaxID=2900151 RepID=UPI001E28F74B|nr:ribonuclease HII [Metabacillus kandeliae]MCD7033799.1 ribonuclease HII [Metabacillus kandeliae]